MDGQIWSSKVFLEKQFFFIIEKKQEEKTIWDYSKNKKGFLLFPNTKKIKYILLMLVFGPHYIFKHCVVTLALDCEKWTLTCLLWH